MMHNQIKSTAADCGARNCLACEAPNPHVFFEVPRVPASVGSLPESAAEARDVQCGAIRLAACEQCGLIQNQLFDVDVVGFEPGYEVSLFHTPTFFKYIQGVCDHLIQRYDLRSKDLFEIGCGGGDFLRLICREGGNRGVGIDPTIPALSNESVGKGSVTFIPGFFSPEHAKYIADFVCCLSVFEDIPKPLEFLRVLRTAIGTRNTPVYFEVFNGYRAIVEREVWSIHYEQCNYYSLDALQRLFRRAGFEITSAGTCYEGDQYLFIEAQPAKSGGDYVEVAKASDVLCTVRDFGDEFKNRRAWWEEKMRLWQAQSREVVVWGSGGKGISFLSSLPESPVKYVVDVNPDRQGRFIPLGGQEIIAPQRLTRIQPQVVVLTNALYEQEIRQQLRELGVECEVLFA